MLRNNLKQISDLNSNYNILHDRVNSTLIEIEDILSEIEAEQEQLEIDPNRLEEVNTKLQLIHNLFLKHTVNSVEDLLKIEKELAQKVETFETIDDQIDVLHAKLQLVENQLNKLAQQLFKSRKNTIPILVDKLIKIVENLGMPNAKFRIDLDMTSQFSLNGKDELNFLFTANKGEDFKSLKKAASGGEVSRIMLTVKSILSRFVQLPTIIFDEIDTGVSGEIAHKMAEIMKSMSSDIQVIVITHLPQIAAKGDSHYKVFKEDNHQTTQTRLIKLKEDERVVEIAEMLSGKNTTSSAIEHAKQLLN